MAKTGVSSAVAAQMYAVIQESGPSGITCTEIRQIMGWQNAAKVINVATACEAEGLLIGMQSGRGGKWYTFPIEELEV